MNQRDFAAALMDPELPCPEGLTAWNGSDPTQRFRVYRNNVIVSLIDALADTYPVTLALVGDEFFRAMARVYAYSNLPGSRLMAYYGGGFPAFIAGFAPAAGLPYLADVALLEYRRVLAYHAGDVPAVSAAAVAAALEDQDSLPSLSLALHPSVSIVASRYAVVSLWAAHQEVVDISAVAPNVPETGLVLRHGLDVEIMRIPEAAGTFISQLQSGTPFGMAAGVAAGTAADFDLAGTLAILLGKSAITALTPSRNLT